MSEQEPVQLSAQAAEVYEKEFVPAMFSQWPPQLADAAGITAGDRVLDVGCGTGVLAREAALRAGAEGRVTGLDLNETMLDVARSIAPDIEWRVGDAMNLPFTDDSFDVVVSQFMLMFIPDRVAALAEMWRVLTPGGRLAVAVWSDSPVYPAVGEIARREGIEGVAESFEPYFDLGDKAKVLGLFNAAGIPNAGIQTRDGWVRFASIDEFIRVEIKGWILADAIDEVAYSRLLEAARKELAEYCESDGRMVFPMNAHVVTAL